MADDSKQSLEGKCNPGKCSQFAVCMASFLTDMSESCVSVGRSGTRAKAGNRCGDTYKGPLTVTMIQLRARIY